MLSLALDHNKLNALIELLSVSIRLSRHLHIQILQLFDQGYQAT